MAETPSERDRDFDRFLSFLDAVVAIAITLLVLPLVELTGEIDRSTSVGDLLRENQADLWGFVLSFAVIARLWLAQHGSVRHVVAYHDRIVLLLVAWALTIVFLPFPTALVAEATDSSITKVLYIGTMLASTLLLAAVEAIVARHPELTDGSDDSDPAVGLANAAMLGLALVVTLAVPATSYVPLLLLLAADRLAALYRRLRGGPASRSRSHPGPAGTDRA